MDTTSYSRLENATRTSYYSLENVTFAAHGQGGEMSGGVVKAPPGCLVVEQGDFVPWDNPDNIISREADFWMSTILFACVVLPVLFVLGVPGNLLSAAVFFKQGLRERINFCLFCLALADILVLLSNFLQTAEKAYRDLVGFSSIMITYLPGVTGVTWVSQFLSAVIASERCFCVVSPFHARKFLKTSTMAAIIIITSAVLLGGMLAIAGPKHTAVCMFDPEKNTTKDIVYVTKYYLDNKEILDIFDVFFYATAFPAIFLLVVTVTTAVTAAKLRTSVAWRQKSVHASASTTTAGKSGSEGGGEEEGRLEAKEVALTKMLIATSIMFIVCLVPILAVQVGTFLVKDLNYDGRYHNLTSVLWNGINCFRCLNSSLNFFIYYTMGSRFRHTLMETILPSCKKSYRRNAGGK